MFQIIRQIDPIQPLTCEVWSLNQHILDQGGIEALPEVERYALEQSDIVSYHYYGDYISSIRLIQALKQYGRPIMCTEWLARCCHNTIQELFPLFYLEKIGCYNWGFVAGKYQTYEPSNGTWHQYEKNKHIDFDFTKWLHDLYRPNHRPYDPREIELIQEFCRQADLDYQKHCASLEG